MYLHLLIWRQFIGMLVGIEMDGAVFNETTIWFQAWRRFKEKAEAMSVRAKNDIRRKESRGEEPPDLAKRQNPLSPLAEWGKSGDLIWDKELVNELNTLAGIKA